MLWGCGAAAIVPVALYNGVLRSGEAVRGRAREAFDRPILVPRGAVALSAAAIAIWVPYWIYTCVTT